MFESPLARLLWLVENRNKVSMKEMLDHLAELHGELKMAGYELARAGHTAMRLISRGAVLAACNGVSMEGLTSIWCALCRSAFRATYYATAYRELYSVIH